MAFTKVLPSGISSASTLTVDSLDSVGAISATSINATTGTFSGNLNVAGVLTYEDVTNVDSIGLVTARSGIHVTGGRVGINSVNATRPTAPLEIRAASTVQTNTGHIVLSGDGATVGEGPQIMFNESGSGSSFAGAYIGHIRQGSNSVGDLVFGTRESAGDLTTVPTERLRIDSSGNYKFRTGSGGTLTLGIANAVGTQIQRLLYDDSDGSLSIGGGTATGYPLKFFTGNDERLRITSSGNVGIGTDNPQEKLQVQGDVRLVDNSPRIGFHDANASTNIQCTGGIEIFDQNGNRGAYMGATEGSNFLSFGISPSAGANPTEKLRITSSGKISINNTSGPTDIPGTAHDTVVVGNSAATGGGITLEVASGNNCAFQMYAQGSQPAGRFLYDGSDNTVKIWSQNSGGTSEDTRMTFKEDGNVEINNGNLVLASGHGIDFSATSDATGKTSELLDDYEEGTWDPTWTGNGASIGSGTYTKVGRLVTLFASITFPSTANTATQVLGGLPFTASSTSAFAGYSNTTGNATYPGFVFRYSQGEYYIVRSASAQQTDLTRAQTSGIAANICIQYTVA